MTKKKEAAIPRWKCPDCSAWVRNDIEEHTCTKAATPYYPWAVNSWTCSRCGAWIFSNQTHNCHYYWTYTTNTAGIRPKYGYGSGNTGSSAA